MIPLETKVIKIADKEYPIKKSPRAYLKFHELTGHSISDFDGSEKDSYYFLYACLWGGGLRVSFDEFLDMTDNEDGMALVQTFASIVREESVNTEKKQKVR